MPNKQPKIFTGVVVSTKMMGTAVVAVSRLVKHPKYGKYLRQTKKFKAHDPENRAVLGEKVRIQETKPISRDKHFIII